MKILLIVFLMTKWNMEISYHKFDSLTECTTVKEVIINGFQELRWNGRGQKMYIQCAKVK